MQTLLPDDRHPESRADDADALDAWNQLGRSLIRCPRAFRRVFLAAQAVEEILERRTDPATVEAMTMPMLESTDGQAA